MSTEREQFEAHFLASRLLRGDDGVYLDQSTEWMWMGWKGRAQAPARAPQPAPLRPPPMCRIAGVNPGVLERAAIANLPAQAEAPREVQIDGQERVVFMPAEHDWERAAFKNLHRALCKWFGYTHDEENWERDQVSLEEHLVKLLAERNKHE